MEAERARRLQERDRHRAEAVRLANSGKPDGAVREFMAALAVNGELSGELSEDAAATLDLLAQYYEYRENWAAARKARRAWPFRCIPC